jgi:hypothetical protein
MLRLLPWRRMEGVEVVQQQAREVLAAHQQASGAFFSDVDQLCGQATDFLAALGKQVRG